MDAVALSLGNRQVVLAVDDNEQNLLLLEEHLLQWGYEVVVARDGREAVQTFAARNPDLIILDIMMPVMDGYEACARIKATPLGRRIPIVMLTALTGSDDKIKALENGADDFLNKPINRDELRTRVQTLLKIRQLRKELDSSENIIVTLTSALENKDPRSGGHIHRVSAYASQICERLGMSANDRETVAKGALLHDIGIIGIPDEILLKAGVHTHEDQRVFNEHTVVGAAILRPLKTFQQFIPMVRWHHEHLDGSGYPDGLRGDEIPLEARIVAIANRFDEIQILPHVNDDSEAIALLIEEAERGHFDRKLIDLLVDALSDAPPRAPQIEVVQLARSRPHPTILCVDDSRTNRELITEALSEAGFQTIPATNGREALAMLAEHPIDLVVLDLVMPIQDGQHTLETIRGDARWEFLPVIVATAHRNEELRKAAIMGGADDFLSYPLNRLELVTRIRSLLRIRDYHSDLEQSQDVICSLALAIEAKDVYTRGHSQRVGDLAYAFSLHLGMNLPIADRIRTAGLLHDIGKIGVPEALLNKKGPLTRDEFLRVIDHPVIGAEMCRPLASLGNVLNLIRHHHERFDGRGYPDGMSGLLIPYEVRLLSIVDAYDALTSHRAYRPAPLNHVSAIETLRRESAAGKWDPHMVNEFCVMLGSAPPDFKVISRPVPTLVLH
ncbi:MAG: HD-GYP domain-containing protein [Thermoanaerobaculia bacterium]